MVQSMGSQGVGHNLVAENSFYINTLGVKVLLFIISTTLPIYCLFVHTDYNIFL